MDERVPDDTFESAQVFVSGDAHLNESVRPSDMASFVPQEAGDESGFGGADAGADGADAPACDPMAAPLPADRDEAVRELVRRYVARLLGNDVLFETRVTWKCFVPGHCKWVVSTTIGVCCEVTYSAVRSLYCLDAYRKTDHLTVDAGYDPASASEV